MGNNVCRNLCVWLIFNSTQTLRVCMREFSRQNGWCRFAFVSGYHHHPNTYTNINSGHFSVHRRWPTNWQFEQRLYNIQTRTLMWRIHTHRHIAIADSRIIAHHHHAYPYKQHLLTLSSISNMIFEKSALFVWFHTYFPVFQMRHNRATPTKYHMYGDHLIQLLNLLEKSRQHVSACRLVFRQFLQLSSNFHSTSAFQLSWNGQGLHRHHPFKQLRFQIQWIAFGYSKLYRVCELSNQNSVQCFQNKHRRKRFLFV